MATFHIDRDGFFTYTIVPANNTYILDRDISLVTEGSPMVVQASATNTTLKLNGQLVAGGLSSALVLSADDSTATVGRHGALMGNFGATIQGDRAEFTNHGLVDGFNYGMQLQGLTSSVLNDGTILGNVYGIIIGENATKQAFEIDNDGLIDSGHTGIYTNATHGAFLLGGDSRIIGETIAIRAVSFAGGTTDVINNGFMKTLDTTAYAGGDGIDTFINNGLIRGDVLLGGGDDFYNDRGGRTIGQVLGGAGSDIYVVSSYKTRIFEDESREANNNDIVRSSVTYLLDGHGEIETLVLTGRGNISGFGNEYDNVIIGNRGNNKIDGGDGSDDLTGGAGRDTFIFRPDLAEDHIRDFENGVDRIQIGGFEARRFEDLELTQAGRDVEIRLFSGEIGEVIVVQNVKLTQIDAGDFIFV